MRESEMKKINKSSEHARALIAQAQLALECFKSMKRASEEDSSANASERSADIELFARKMLDCERMMRWWRDDIARSERKSEASKSAELEASKSAELEASKSAASI
jgi:hypothetical protein